MAFQHGRDTYVSIAGSDLSAFSNASELTRTGDKHDVTTYGKDDYVYSTGLRGGSFKVSGVYDTTLAGPRAILNPLVGTLVAVIRRTEGTGSGLPQDSFQATLDKYAESNPVADMVTWSADLTISDAVDYTPQP